MTTISERITANRHPCRRDARVRGLRVRAALVVVALGAILASCANIDTAEVIPRRLFGPDSVRAGENLDLKLDDVLLCPCSHFNPPRVTWVTDSLCVISLTVETRRPCNVGAPCQPVPVLVRIESVPDHDFEVRVSGAPALAMMVRVANAPATRGFLRIRLVRGSGEPIVGARVWLLASSLADTSEARTTNSNGDAGPFDACALPSAAYDVVLPDSLGGFQHRYYAAWSKEPVCPRSSALIIKVD